MVTPEWFQNLSPEIQTLLLGAGGNLMGGLGADITGRFLSDCAGRIQKKFKPDPKRRALNVAMAHALVLTSSFLGVPQDQCEHFLKIYGEWLQEEAVFSKLNQLFEPGREMELDDKEIEELKAFFDSKGFLAEYIGRHVDFNEALTAFVRAFPKAADEQEELAGQIRTKLLRGIHERMGRIVQQEEKQTESLRRIADAVVPDLSGPWRQYAEGICRLCGFLPLRGVDFSGADAATCREDRIGLADVYIHLDTTAQKDVKDRTDGKKSREDFDTEKAPLSVLEAMAAQNRMVLLGGPGSGKSTFVHYLCYCLARHRLEPDGGWMERLGAFAVPAEGKMPLPVVLRELAAWMRKEKPSETGVPLLLAYLKRHWLKRMLLDDVYPELKKAIQENRALLLLDGLDEVPADETAIIAVKKIITELNELFPDASFLVTCRVLSYQDSRWRLSTIKLPTYELRPLDREKINRFIGVWYDQLGLVNAVSDPAAASNKLRSAVTRPDLQPLATNPLLLTVMAMVHSHKGELPDARPLLYEDVADLLLWRWEAIKLQDEEGETTWREILQEAGLKEIDIKQTLWKLAFEAHARSGGKDNGEATADIPEIDLLSAFRLLHPEKSYDWAAQVIRMIQKRAGLLLEEVPSIYRFPHRTFQEYMAACRLGAQTNFVGRVVQLAEQGSFWWEVIRLAVGRMVHFVGEHETPLLLVDALCPKQIPADKDIDQWRNAWLAGCCLTEIGLDRAWRQPGGEELVKAVVKHLADLVSGGMLSPRERAEAGVVLGRLGDGRQGIGLDAKGVPEIDWCDVPAGEFFMGSEDEQDEDTYEDEFPGFPCGLISKGYRISRYPVTVCQYEAFTEAGGYDEKRYWTDAGWKWRKEEGVIGPETYGEPYQTSNHPIVGVSWYEAWAYCCWLSGKLRHSVRLSTEAEWEKAARGTDGSVYPWGKDFDSTFCNMGDTGIGSTSAVGIFPEGESPYECMDMAGNVLEWCSTKWRSNYQDYEQKADDDPEGEGARVLRGGAFHLDRRHVRCAYRFNYHPNFRNFSVGFRVVAPGL